MELLFAIVCVVYGISSIVIYDGLSAPQFKSAPSTVLVTLTREIENPESDIGRIKNPYPRLPNCS